MKAATATTHVTNRSSLCSAALRNRPGGVARHLPGYLDDPGFDPCAALKAHGKLLRGQLQRLRALLKTIDNTLHYLSEDDMCLNERELYAGFSKAEIAAMKAEVYQRFDAETVRLSQQRVVKLGKQQVAWIKHEQQSIAENAALLVAKAPDRPEVRKLMARQLAWLENFYPVSAERFKGLGQMYVEDARFRRQYDVYGEGTAKFMCAAMAWYADHVMNRD